MNKRIVPALAAAAILIGAYSGAGAAEGAVLSKRASVTIDDSGYINGLTGETKAGFIAAQFDGTVSVVSSDGAEIAEDANVPSDSVVMSGGNEIAKVVIPADVNRDGDINLADVVCMLQSIAKWKVDICSAAADADQSGAFDMDDAVFTLRYIADWDLTLREPEFLHVFEAGKTEYKLLAGDSSTDEKIVSAIKELTGTELEVTSEAAEGDRFITVGKNLYEKYDFIDEGAVKNLSDTDAYIDTYDGNIYLTAASDNGILGCINYLTAQAFTPELDMNIAKGSVGVLGDKETLITPTFTELKIKGISNSYRFLHVTDSHITTIYDDEENELRRADVNSRLNDWIMNMYRKPSYMFLDSYFDYAEDVDADAILMTGDITDSPSLSNIDILKNAITGCKVPSYFIYGNHDWTWNDQYQNSMYRVLYESRFAGAVADYEPEWDDAANCVEYSDMMIVSVDNSNYSFDRNAFSGLSKYLAEAKEKGKPVILMLHVPFHTEEMHPKVEEVWPGGGSLCIGPGGTCDMAGAFTARACELILAEDSPVAAIFAGHVHFDFETMVDGRIPQIVTGSALDGHCRVVDLVPES